MKNFQLGSNGWNHEVGLHFCDNLVSKISENQFSAELNLFFGRKNIFSAELLFGRNNKRQIDWSHYGALDLRVKTWSDGYFFSSVKFSAELSFGRNNFRPNNLSTERLFGRKYFLYNRHTSPLNVSNFFGCVVGAAAWAEPQREREPSRGRSVSGGFVYAAWAEQRYFLNC